MVENVGVQFNNVFVAIKAATLRELFLKYLTIDSETRDARRREFNQAIFNAERGWAIFDDTDLDMVMKRFDKAVKEWLKS